jgi:hypothetical protein
MDVIRLNFFGDNRPVMGCAKFVDHYSCFNGDSSGQNIAPIFWAPYQMVCHLGDAISIIYDFNHVDSLSHMESQAQAAIPPVTKVADFLARIL